jgi:hypothetical protein
VPSSPDSRLSLRARELGHGHWCFWLGIVTLALVFGLNVPGVILR